MSTEDEEKKKRAKALKFLKKEFELEEPKEERKKEKRRKRQCHALRRILRTYMPEMSVKGVYERLVLWCDSNDKEPSVFLLDRWCSHQLEWDQEKKSGQTKGEDEEERRKRTKEHLARYS